MTNLRNYFCSTYLKGQGLELGSLHRPMPKHDDMELLYVDRYNKERLKEHYPELGNEIVIEPGLLCDVQYLPNPPFLENAYDFLISSHIIEHMKNPILAIKNWLRVLKPGGYLYLVVPDHRKIFDRDRQTTTLYHMFRDHNEPSRSRDLGHYMDYAEHVNGARGTELLTEAQRLIDTDYSIHFHCFTPDSMRELLITISDDCAAFTIIEGPAIDNNDDHEFHFLLRKN